MNSSDSRDRGDLRALLVLLRRRASLVVLAIVVAAAAGYGIAQLMDDRYESTSTLLFRPLLLDAQLTGLPLQAPPDDAQAVETNVKLVSLGIIRQRAAQRLGPGYTEKRLREDVEIEADGQSSLVRVEASAPTPEAAATVANAVAQAYVSSRADSVQSQVQSAIDRLRASYLRTPDKRSDAAKVLRAGFEKLRLLRFVATGDAQIVEPADVPTSAAAPRPKRAAAIGAFLGLLIGLALALVAEQLDRRVRRPEQLEEALDLPVLAHIPKSNALGDGGTGEADPRVGEAFRQLRARLGYAGPEGGPRSLLVTSTASGSGKTTVAVNLALAAAASQRVLLVEADLRRPRIGALLGLTGERGLVDVLAEGGSLGADDVRHVLRSGGADDGDGAELDVLVAGRPTPRAGDLLASDEMRSLLADAREQYDLVIVDGPAPRLVSDAIPLMRQLDGVVVVGRIGRDARSDLESLRRELARLDVTRLGVVANFSRSTPEFYGADPAR